jgi:hypothetical protein
MLVLRILTINIIITRIRKQKNNKITVTTAPVVILLLFTKYFRVYEYDNDEEGNITQTQRSEEQAGTFQEIFFLISYNTNKYNNNNSYCYKKLFSIYKVLL